MSSMVFPTVYGGGLAQFAVWWLHGTRCRARGPCVLRGQISGGHVHCGRAMSWRVQQHTQDTNESRHFQVIHTFWCLIRYLGKMIICWEHKYLRCGSYTECELSIEFYYFNAFSLWKRKLNELWQFSWFLQIFRSDMYWSICHVSVASCVPLVAMPFWLELVAVGVNPWLVWQQLWQVTQYFNLRFLKTMGRQNGEKTSR